MVELVYRLHPRSPKVVKLVHGLHQESPKVVELEVGFHHGCLGSNHRSPGVVPPWESKVGEARSCASPRMLHKGA